MSQNPVSVKVAFPPKTTFITRPNIVQVLQPQHAGQTIIQQRPPTMKPFTTIKQYIPTLSASPINTNTAVQYVRKPTEVAMFGAANTFIAAPVGQNYAPFGNPLMNLNPGMVSSIPSGPAPVGSGQVNSLSNAVLSSMANSRKPCNCTKSHCLKLYCECFAQGQLCQNCNCNNCMNNLAYEEERGRAIKMTLERNPTAFHPKIGRGEGERKHTKGCNCKRSGCLKNYCECYEAKISCSDLCRCQGCRNTEDSVERRSLMRLAAMGALRSRQPNAFKRHLMKPPAETMSHIFFTWEVIESISSCLLAQADEAERRDLPPAAQERIILEEFGRLLEKVIDSASKAQVRPTSGLHTSASLDDEDNGLMHTASNGKGNAVGAAAAAAAAADVLRDDDDDEIMHGIGVDDDDPDDLDDDMYGDLNGSTVPHHNHLRSHASRRVPGSHRSSHIVPDLDDDMMSDEDSVDRGMHVSSRQLASQRFQDNSRRHNPNTEPRYSIHHSRRSGSRSHRHHDPDSII